MKNFVRITLLFALLGVHALSAKLNVVATTTDIASIAAEVGKEKVSVASLAKGNDDLHYVSARPDFILKASRADVFAQVGLELEVGWVPLILEQSRNAKIHKNGTGHCDLSKGIKVLEKPSGTISRQMGDIHASGNPHYWLDPVNGIKMARSLARCFSRVDPANKNAYEQNYQAFRQKAKALTKRLLVKMKPHFGKKIMPYHSEFIYLARRFRLKVPASIEEIPGVKPGLARQRKMIKLAKETGVKAIVVAPWNPLSLPRRIARDGGIKLLILPVQTGATEAASDYLKTVENTVNLLESVL